MLTLRLPGCLGGVLFSGRQCHMLSSLPWRTELTAAPLSCLTLREPHGSTTPHELLVLKTSLLVYILCHFKSEFVFLFVGEMISGSKTLFCQCVCTLESQSLMWSATSPSVRMCFVLLWLKKTDTKEEGIHAMILYMHVGALSCLADDRKRGSVNTSGKL